MPKLALAFDILANDAKAARTLDHFASKSEKTGKRVGGAFGALGKSLVGAVAGFATISVFKGFIAEAEESRKVGRLTAQVIKTTGKAAHVSARQVGELAEAISNKTGIDDEAIQSGANLLLTFTNIRNEVGKGNRIFDRATETITDMSVALGTDTRASAIQLGKALNDPIKGVTALSKVGVSFTEQQKKQIKTLVESGKTLDAQKVILAELGREFGGAAAAAATPSEKLKVAIGNIGESIGTLLLPAVDRVATFLNTEGIPAINGFIGGFQDGVGAGGRFRDILSELGRDGKAAWGKVQPFFSFIGDHPKLFAELAKDAAILAAAMKGISLVKKLPGLGSLLGGGKGGPLGGISKAAPLPVFVTNPGFGGPGTPSGRGAPGGGRPPVAPVAARGGRPPVAPVAARAVALGIGSVLLTSGDAGPASDVQKSNRQFVIALNKLADSKGQYDKARVELLTKAGGINWDTSDAKNRNRKATQDLVAAYDFLVKYGKKTAETRKAIADLAKDPTVAAALKQRASQFASNVNLISGGLLKAADLANTSSRKIGDSLQTNVGTGVRGAMDRVDRLDSSLVTLGKRRSMPLVKLSGGEQAQRDAQTLLFYLKKLDGLKVNAQVGINLRTNNDLPLPVGARAKGGPVEAGRAYVVGEPGPELFVPRTSGTIYNQKQLATVGGGGFTINGGVSITVADNKTALSVPDQLRNMAFLAGL